MCSASSRNSKLSEGGKITDAIRGAKENKLRPLLVKQRVHTFGAVLTLNVHVREGVRSPVIRVCGCAARGPICASFPQVYLIVLKAVLPLKSLPCCAKIPFM